MHEFARLAKTYLKQYWARLLLAIVLTSMAAMSPFFFTYMGKIIVDDVLEIPAKAPPPEELSQEDPASPFADHDYLKPNEELDGTIDTAFLSKTGKTPGQKVKLLFLMLCLYLLVHGTMALCRWVSRYIVSLTGQKLVFELRRDLHRKLQSLQMTYFDQVQTGKLMSRIIDDVDVIESQVTNTVINMATYLVMLIVGGGLLFIMNWKMALVACSCLPVYVVAYKCLVRQIRDYTRKAREVNSMTYGYFQQKISGIRVVKSFVREKWEMLQYHGLGKKYLRLIVTRSVMQAALSCAAMVLSGVGAAFVLWYGAVLVRSGSMTLGEMLFFHGTSAILFGPVTQLADTNVIIQWLAVVVGRVLAILDEKVTIKDRPGAVDLNDVRGNVEFHNVSLTYVGADPRSHGGDVDVKEDAHSALLEIEEPELSRTVALRDVNLKIEAGTMACIMGASGSGKSSLVHLIPRLYEPESGVISIDGTDIGNVKLSSLRKHVGLVPQATAIFSGNIADNIRYGEPYASIEDVIEAATAAEIHEFIDSLPDKYKTVVGEQGVTLSGGQKQRLSIARALLTRPKLLLLDDCTSALDAKTEARLQGTLSRVLRDHTSIVITHRTSMAMKADKIVVLCDGRIVEEGAHQELIDKKGFYRRIFDSQQGDVDPATSALSSNSEQ